MSPDTFTELRIPHPFAELIGLRVFCQDPGKSRCSLRLGPSLMNPHNVCHGGVLYSLADTGMGAALYPCLQEGESCSTIENKIVYFKPVKTGELTCDTHLVHKGKTVAILESEIHNDGELVAKALGTFSVFKIA